MKRKYLMCLQKNKMSNVYLGECPTITKLHFGVTGILLVCFV